MSAASVAFSFKFSLVGEADYAVKNTPDIPHSTKKVNKVLQIFPPLRSNRDVQIHWPSLDTWGGGVRGDGMTVTNSTTSDSSIIYHFVSNEGSWNAYYHTIHFFFLSIGRDPNTWPANNCLQIMVCSCLVPSERVLLRIIFCSCLVRTTFSKEKWQITSLSCQEVNKI